MIDGDYVNCIEQIDVVYAKNVSEAKGKCLYYEFENGYGEEAKWIDIKCRRVPEKDLFEYNGETKTKKQIERELEKEKRNEKLKQLDENEMYYVQDSRSYVGNCVLWWGKNSSGYVCSINEAHKYTKQEIIAKFIDGRDTDIVWNAKHIEGNIKQVVDIQNINQEFSV